MPGLRPRSFLPLSLSLSFREKYKDTFTVIIGRRSRVVSAPRLSRLGVFQKVGLEFHYYFGPGKSQALISRPFAAFYTRHSWRYFYSWRNAVSLSRDRRTRGPLCRSPIALDRALLDHSARLLLPRVPSVCRRWWSLQNRDHVGMGKYYSRNGKVLGEIEFVCFHFPRLRPPSPMPTAPDRASILERDEGRPLRCGCVEACLSSGCGSLTRLVVFKVCMWLLLVARILESSLLI